MGVRADGGSAGHAMVRDLRHESASGRAVAGILASEKPAIDLDREIDAVAVAATIGQIHARISSLRTTPSAEGAVWLDPKDSDLSEMDCLGQDDGRNR